MHVVCLLALTLAAAAPVSELKAVHRSGQTFLTWRETAPQAGVRFDVLMAAEPITRADQPGVTRLARHLLPGSAGDWWLNPETYGNPLKADANGQKPAIPHEGWRIEEGGQRLDPDSGLFVHTVTAVTAGARFFAVVDPANPVISPGANSLAAPVTQQVATPQPIWQGEPAQKPKPGTGRGLALDLILHAKTGRGGQDWLMFGDAQLGWREGLPFKYGAAVRGDSVQLTPTDRTWIDRMLTEGRDGCQKLTPAVHSFWFGYNDHLDEPAAMKTGTVVPFTERRLLWLIDWTKAYFGTDPHRSYCTGSSMGGCGTISFGLHHPEIFAACLAWVPIVAYGRGPGGDSAMRVEAECGGLDQRTSEGLTVRERLDSTRFVRTHNGDLPALFVVNGRRDTSIPWWKCPDFYRALRDRRQALVAAWNEGTHATASGLLPADLKERFSLRYLRRYRLDQSYLAFSECSSDDDPGRGDQADGAPVGAMGRGLEHDPPQETPARAEVVVRWYLDAARLPVTATVTWRRLRLLAPRAGMKYTFENHDLGSGTVVGRSEVTVGADGLVTIPAVKVTSVQGNRLVLARP